MLDELESQLAPEVDCYCKKSYICTCPWCEKEIEFDDLADVEGVHFCPKCKESFRISEVTIDNTQF